MNTVLVCDTVPIAIEGLRSLLESVEGMRVVAAENTLEDGADAVEELQPAIVVVDKAFGINAVMDWVQTLKAGNSRLATVVWSSSLCEAEALRFLQAGAKGVVRKTAPLSELLNCLRTVASGGTWMDGNLAAGAPRPVRIGRSKLTARELQVMELIERGYKNKAIALALGIQTGTVKIHLKHIFEKTGIRGRYELAILGLKQKGLLAIPLA
ncbi:MAG TPA: response regulator transcription factor [Candidatus Acidoferrales bacterium]|nr:response regulator transcription factor [Candidatus Acidoferrales bacterium]